MWVELTVKVDSNEPEHDKVEHDILINLENVHAIFSIYDAEDRREKTNICFGDGRSNVVVEESYDDIKNLIKERQAVNYI